MLVNPTPKRLEGIDKILQGLTYNNRTPVEDPRPGIVMNGGWNIEYAIKETVNQYPQFPLGVEQRLDNAEEWIDELNAYGVCDSVEQLLAAYDFEGDPRKLFISFVELRKADEPPSGGWRWHKWGPYIGTQDPQCEYLAHETNIDKVYTYHIYEIIS